MIVRSDQRYESRMDGCCEGIGETVFEHLLLENDLPDHVNLTTVVRLLQGNSIGLHYHYDETEYYFILEGEGIIQDDDDFAPIKKGDFLVTKHGHKHSIANTQAKPLLFLAIIISRK